MKCVTNMVGDCRSAPCKAASIDRWTRIQLACELFTVTSLLTLHSLEASQGMTAGPMWVQLA